MTWLKRELNVNFTNTHTHTHTNPNWASQTLICEANYQIAKKFVWIEKCLTKKENWKPLRVKRAKKLMQDGQLITLSKKHKREQETRWTGYKRRPNDAQRKEYQKR